jgi:hypothetical protein
MYDAQPDDIICTTVIEGKRIDFAWPEDLLPPTHFNFDYDGEFIVGNYPFYDPDRPHHESSLSTNWATRDGLSFMDGYLATGVGYTNIENSALSGEITLVEVEEDTLIQYAEGTSKREEVSCECPDCRPDMHASDENYALGA